MSWALTERVLLKYYLMYNYTGALTLRVRGVVRKIGNSLGLIIPAEEVQNHKIREGDVVELEVEKRVNLKDMFGSLKLSRTSQELKDETRRDWGD